MISFPFWQDKSVHGVIISIDDERDICMSSKKGEKNAVVLSGSKNCLSIKGARSLLSAKTLRFLSVCHGPETLGSFLSDLNVVSLKTNCLSNLTGLDIVGRIDANILTSSVASLLKQTPNLQQLRICILHDEKETFRTLMRIIRSLPLTAFDLRSLFENDAKAHAQILLDEYLLHAEVTAKLRYLAIDWSNNDCTLIVGEMLPKCSFPILHTFRFPDFSSGWLDNSMPRLQVLDLLFSRPECVPAFVRWIDDAKFRPLLRLELRAPFLTQEQANTLFESFAAGTRLREIALLSHGGKIECSRRLLDCGWITEYSQLYMRRSDDVDELLDRNRQRHAECNKSCIALLALRRYKRALLAIPYDIVCIVARYLWDTRNQHDWDRHRDKPQKIYKMDNDVHFLY